MNRRLLITERSPFARKVRVVLREKGLACEEIAVDLAHKPPILVNSGPIQKVPVLFDGGLTVADSTVICEYLEERYPAVRLMPHDYLRRADVRLWSQAAHEMAEAAIQVRSERLRHGSVRDLGALEKHQRLHDRILNYADEMLANRDYLVGHDLGLADISFLSAVGYSEFRLGDGWRKNRSALVRYYDAHIQRKSFLETMPRG
jgi:glutathione S-transferase